MTKKRNCYLSLPCHAILFKKIKNVYSKVPNYSKIRFYTATLNTKWYKSWLKYGGRWEELTASHWRRTVQPGTDPASEIRGGRDFSIIFVIQVSLRVHYFKGDEVYFTTLLWHNNGRQNVVFRIVKNYDE